jgi:hypothetical protein
VNFGTKGECIVFSSLTDKQIQFLDALGKGPKGLRELLDDFDLTWRQFNAWRQEAGFAEALDGVFEWLDFEREVDVRVGATEALRRQRLNVCGQNRDLFMSDRQRELGDGLWRKVRELDKKFPRQWRQPGTSREISPVHPDYLHEAHTIVQRMEELRRAALEAKAGARKQLPAPVECGGAREGAGGEEEQEKTSR